MSKDSAARIQLGRSFHQMGTVNEKVCESIYMCIYIYIYIYYTNLTQSRKNKSNFIFAKSTAYSLLKSKQRFFSISILDFLI